MNNDKMTILAKPSGITLKKHISDVEQEASLILRQNPFLAEKYLALTKNDLSVLLLCACHHHDDGKRHILWQKACQKDFDAFREWGQTHKGTFNEYASDKPVEAGRNLRKAHIRHECLSLLDNDSSGLPLIVQVAIAAHHGKLGYSYEDRWEEANCSFYWKQFQKLANDKAHCSLQDIAETMYQFAGVRSLLQLADHRASAKEDGETIPDFTSFSYKFPYKDKRGVQKAVEEHWKDDLLIVRAPTGSGKTDAALLWAANQIKNKMADRLIIAMPTRFTSNALSISIAESLSETGLYHSSAWFDKFQDKIDKGVMTRSEALKKLESARLLENPITVCTIDHLLMSLTLTREDHQLIDFNLANSCVVIDEADFYDEFTQLNILVLLTLLRHWKVPVLLMSASLPESILPEYRNIGYDINGIIEDTSDYERKRFNVKEIRYYSEIDEIEDILLLMIEKRNGIIYANTVSKAVSFYNWFKAYYSRTGKSLRTILYHSKFTEPDKVEKESQIIEALGHQAWNDHTAEGIVIMTQIGEISINISAEIMISEICPIDRLAQRAGRLCRFDNNKIGELYILVPTKDGILYPAPYGTLSPSPFHWEPYDSLISTLKIIEKKEYSAGDIVNLINIAYKYQKEHSELSSRNADNLIKYFTANWLINPTQQSEKDDDLVNFWKSRDIAPQETVYIAKPISSFFRSMSEFRIWAMQLSIEIPIYVVKKLGVKHITEVIPITIDDEKTNIIVIREGFYNSEIGVISPESDNIEQQLI